jgi:hypothetical protein
MHQNLGVLWDMQERQCWSNGQGTWMQRRQTFARLILVKILRLTVGGQKSNPSKYYIPMLNHTYPQRWLIDVFDKVCQHDL